MLMGMDTGVGTAAGDRGGAVPRLDRRVVESTWEDHSSERASIVAVPLWGVYVLL